jgi:hypothetical protein
MVLNKEARGELEQYISFQKRRGLLISSGIWRNNLGT